MLPHGTSQNIFGDKMKKAGAPVELKSETIGHSSVALKKHYTSDFEEAKFTYQQSSWIKQLRNSYRLFLDQDNQWAFPNTIALRHSGCSSPGAK